MRRTVVVTLALIVTACNADIGEPTGRVIVQDAGADGAATQPATNKGLGVACTDGTECESGLCFVGGQASYCSLRCTADNGQTVCMPPVFDGTCNKQGYCRRP